MLVESSGACTITFAISITQSDRMTSESISYNPKLFKGNTSDIKEKSNEKLQEAGSSLTAQWNQGEGKGEEAEKRYREVVAGKE